MLTKQLDNLKPKIISSATFHGSFYKYVFLYLSVLQSWLVTRDVVIRATLTQTKQKQSKWRKALSCLQHMHG